MFAVAGHRRREDKMAFVYVSCFVTLCIEKSYVFPRMILTPTPSQQPGLTPFPLTQNLVHTFSPPSGRQFLVPGQPINWNMVSAGANFERVKINAWEYSPQLNAPKHPLIPAIAIYCTLHYILESLLYTLHCVPESRVLLVGIQHNVLQLLVFTFLTAMAYDADRDPYYQHRPRQPDPYGNFSTKKGSVLCSQI